MIFSRAALAMKAERVNPRACAAASIACSRPASNERFALAARPVGATGWSMARYAGHGGAIATVLGIGLRLAYSIGVMRVTS
jgi:hypothetical protein